MLEQKLVALQNLRYKYLAYCVIRDAIGFYFGIPKLFKQCGFTQAVEDVVAMKLQTLEEVKQRKPTEKEIEKCKRLTEKLLTARLRELTVDYNHSKDVLFVDNHWLQWLDLNAEFLKSYLDGLPEHMKDELAVVPKWGTRDHSLGRPYINDNFEFNTISF